MILGGIAAFPVAIFVSFALSISAEWVVIRGIVTYGAAYFLYVVERLFFYWLNLWHGDDKPEDPNAPIPPYMQNLPKLPGVYLDPKVDEYLAKQHEEYYRSRRPSPKPSPSVRYGMLKRGVKWELFNGPNDPDPTLVPGRHIELEIPGFYDNQYAKPWTEPSEPPSWEVEWLDLAEASKTESKEVESLGHFYYLKPYMGWSTPPLPLKEKALDLAEPSETKSKVEIPGSFDPHSVKPYKYTNLATPSPLDLAEASGTQRKVEGYFDSYYEMLDAKLNRDPSVPPPWEEGPLGLVEASGTESKGKAVDMKVHPHYKVPLFSEKNVEASETENKGEIVFLGVPSGYESAVPLCPKKQGQCEACRRSVSGFCQGS